MKKYSALTLIVALAVGLSQIAQAQGGKEAKQAKGSSEANRLAREGAEALKSNDLDKAVDLLRKATNLDHKYTPDLAIAYERRGYALAKNQQFQDAVQDYAEAITIKWLRQRRHCRSIPTTRRRKSGNSVWSGSKLKRCRPRHQTPRRLKNHRRPRKNPEPRRRNSAAL